VEIRKADLSIPAVVDAWHRVYADAQRFERPFAHPYLSAEVREHYSPNLRRDATAWEGVVDGRVVCAGTIEMPKLDNLHMATVGVYVDPPHLRRGYGSQMLEHLEGIARGAGRRTAYAETEYPLEAPEDGRGCAGPEFAIAHGYTFALGEIMRSQPLPIDADRLEELAVAAGGHHRDYRLVVFSGRVPDEWVADYVGLEARIASDAPQGSREVEAGSDAVGPFREGEERVERQDRVAYIAVALQGERAVGFTKVTVPRSDRTTGDQWGTLVASEHRGHRLGLALKVANLQQLQKHEPELRSVITWNAEVNAPMISVNEQLGYVPVERGGGFEKR
jgi:GNAT superfamily N-acetyltransferase